MKLGKEGKFCPLRDILQKVNVPINTIFTVFVVVVVVVVVVEVVVRRRSPLG